jgi:drug/metabolite transporter (DMT)-like permease
VCARGGAGVESETATEDRAAVLTEASLLMAVFFLGTNPVAVKLAVLDVPPLPFVAIWFLLAGLLLLPVALLLGQGREVGWKDLLSMAGVGFVGVASGVALLGEDLTVNKIIGGAVILAGVYLARRQ